jgi:hypothetical protein
MSSFSKAHADGRLKEKLQEVMAYISALGSMAVAFITIPAMPVIYYMTILFNVIMTVVTFFRNL